MTLYRKKTGHDQKNKTKQNKEKKTFLLKQKNLIYDKFTIETNKYEVIELSLSGFDGTKLNPKKKSERTFFVCVPNRRSSSESN